MDYDTISARCENQKITNMDYDDISAIRVLCAILAFFALCMILFICFPEFLASGYTSQTDYSKNI